MKIKEKTYRYGILFLLMVMLGAAPAQAQMLNNVFNNEGEGFGEDALGILWKIDLTETQQADALNVVKSYLSDVEAYRTQLQDAEDVLQRLIYLDTNSTVTTTTVTQDQAVSTTENATGDISGTTNFATQDTTGSTTTGNQTSATSSQDSTNTNQTETESREAMIRSASQNVALIKEELTVLKANAVDEIKAILTADQLTAFNSEVEKMLERQQRRKEIAGLIAQMKISLIEYWLGSTQEEAAAP
jgi:hypothetical protein